MSKLLPRLVLAASCLAIAATLPAVAQKPSAGKRVTCEEYCYNKHYNCLAAGTSALICDRQLEACLDKCRFAR